MNAMSFANRLVRDFSVKNLSELTADGKQELLDAINGTLQEFHDIAPDHSKTGPVSLALDAPETVEIGVTKGSHDVTGHVFTSGHLYHTIRINGDGIDNEISGESTLTHAYAGETGTVTATVYCDAVVLPPYVAEIVSDPVILETRTRVVNIGEDPWKHHVLLERSKQVCRPHSYWMEANSANRNPPAGPMVMRFSTFPDQDYRLKCDAVMVPVRIGFSDLLTSHTLIPLREEHVEAYLLPVARAKLTESSLWADKETAARVASKGADAESRYAAIVPQYTSTPNHRVRTRHGF